MSERTPSPENEFLHEHLRASFEDAKERMAQWYLDERSGQAFLNHVQLDFIGNGSLGQEIPTARFDGRTNAMHMRVKPEVILEFAHQLVDDTDLEVSDVVRCLVGAGVARCIVGWKTLPIKMAEHAGLKRHELQEKLCEQGPLLAAAEKFDLLHGTRLVPAIERLGDARMTDINVLRFAVGASLQQMSDVIGWPPKWQNVVEEALIEQETQRNLDLRTALAILEPENAWMLYDDETPVLLLALNFPMTPAEELDSFATQTY